jgi:DNA-directed RNA polymerase subunit F
VDWSKLTHLLYIFENSSELYKEQTAAVEFLQKYGKLLINIAMSANELDDELLDHGNIGSSNQLAQKLSNDLCALASRLQKP